MTVANAISEQFYLGDGVTTSFDFTYPVQAVTDLVVSVNGYAMTLGVDYSGVLLVGGASGARITFTAAPANGATVFLLRAPPVSQGFAFVAGMKIWEGTIGAVVDKLTMLVAKLSRRALVLSDTDPTTSPLVLPSKSVRAGTALGFDSNGNPTTLPVTPITSYAGLFSQINTWLAQQIFKTASDAFTATAGYSGGTTNARVLAVSGAVAAPGSTQDAAAVVQKSTASVATSGVNPAHYASIFKTVSGANTRATASYAEGQDSAGGAGSWVEAFRGYAGITAGRSGRPSAASSRAASALASPTPICSACAQASRISLASTRHSGPVSTGANTPLVSWRRTTGLASATSLTSLSRQTPIRALRSAPGSRSTAMTGPGASASITPHSPRAGSCRSGSTSRARHSSDAAPAAEQQRGSYEERGVHRELERHDRRHFEPAHPGRGRSTDDHSHAAHRNRAVDRAGIRGKRPADEDSQLHGRQRATKDRTITFNGAASLTLTLPAAASWTGRRIRVRTIAAFTVVSASSNVVPLAGGAAGTAILAAIAGKWADLESDGSNWIITAGN